MSSRASGSADATKANHSMPPRRGVNNFRYLAFVSQEQKSKSAGNGRVPKGKEIIKIKGRALSRNLGCGCLSRTRHLHGRAIAVSFGVYTAAKADNGHYCTYRASAWWYSQLSPKHCRHSGEHFRAQCAPFHEYPCTQLRPFPIPTRAGL